MSDDLDRTVRMAHRTILAMIAVCAVLAWMQPGLPDEPAPDPVLTTVAVTLGLAVILLRGAARASTIGDRARLTLLLSSYACAFGLALLGAFVAMTALQPRTGLAFGLAAMLFCLRPPAPSPSSG